MDHIESVTPSIEAPVQSREQSLPFAKISWQNFERLCLRLVRLNGMVEHTQFYGVQGDEQEGIDIYARHRSDEKYSTYQCKNEKEYGPAKIKAAVHAFINGPWALKSSTFVLCTRESLSPKARADEVEAQAKRLRKHGISFLPWDEGRLCELLKEQHEIVDDFFGRPWVKAFCGEEAAARLGDRITAQQSEIALEAYYSWLTEKIGKVVYRGIAHHSSNERAINLPLERIYVQPSFLPEDEHDVSRAREREIIRLLRDPDIDKAHQGKLEAEFLALKMSDWYKPQFSWENGWEVALPAMSAEIKPVPLTDILSSRHCVVLGSPGSGKSTLLRWLTLKCVTSSLQPEKTDVLTAITDDTLYFPVLVSLAAFANAIKAEKSLTLSGYVDKHLQSLGIPELHRLYRNNFHKGCCWLLLDGIDEIAEADIRIDVVKAIESFMSGIGNNRCWLTSRLHGYERVAGLPHFHIRPLNTEQISTFIFAWNFTLELELNPEEYDLDRGSDHGESLIAQLNDNKTLGTLATNPLLLVALLLMHRQNHTLPESRVEIYHSMTQTLLETWNRWRSESRYHSGGQTLTSSDLRKVLAKVALWSKREMPRGILRRGELQRRFVAALQELQMETNDLQETAQSYLNAAVEQAGLLEERAPGIFAFWHPSFEEYLAALELVTPIDQATEKLLPLRFNPHWHEVVLLAIGSIGIVDDNITAASDLVQTLVRSDVPPTESILHSALRLGIACIAENPRLDRHLVQELLHKLTEVLTVQPYEPMAGSFLDVTAALHNLKPDESLVEALGRLAVMPHSLGAVKASIFMLVSNVAASNDKALKMCQDQADKDIDAQFPEKDVMSRFYAIIGLIKADHMSERYLAELAWHNRTIQYINEVVELLQIGPGVETNSYKQRLLQEIQSYLVLPQHKETASPTFYPGAESIILGPLAAALILLFAGLRSKEICDVIKEALKPKYDLCGAAFDAAQAPLLFEMGDNDVLLELHRLAFVSLRRWLKHPNPYRRTHSADLLLNHIEKWERQFGPIFETMPEFADRVEEAKDEKFLEAYRIARSQLRHECIQALKSCLNRDHHLSRLQAADLLLQRGHAKVVALAIEKWLKSGMDHFHPFMMIQLTSALSDHPEGEAIVLKWMHSENDWLKVVSSSALYPKLEHRVAAAEVKNKCLELPNDEIRSALGGSLAMFASIEGRQLDPTIEKALRSCLGSERGDASRNAAAVLYRSGFREEELLQHLAEYMTTQEVGERFDTLRAFQEHDAAVEFLADLSEVFGANKLAVQSILDEVQRAKCLTEEDILLLRELINRKEEEDHDVYFCRRCIYDWIWFNLEAKSTLQTSA